MPTGSSSGSSSSTACPTSPTTTPSLVGATVRDQLANDLSLERAALGVLRPGVALCLDAGDHASRDLLEHILRDEEDHVDWIEAQQHKIGEIGYEGYLAQQIYERS